MLAWQIIGRWALAIHFGTLKLLDTCFFFFSTDDWVLWVRTCAPNIYTTLILQLHMFDVGYLFSQIKTQFGIFLLTCNVNT